MLLINQHTKKKLKPGLLSQHGGSRSPFPRRQPLLAKAGSHTLGARWGKNPNQFTDKTENGFAESCLGYSKKPFLSGVLGQLELFELTFFSPCQKQTG